MFAFVVALPALVLLPGSPQPHMQAAGRAAVTMAEPVRVEVCQNKYCRKKGSAKTLALMEEAAAGRDDVIVCKADMSHTEHGCFEYANACSIHLLARCLHGALWHVGARTRADGPHTLCIESRA